ncbi:MAG TPA: glycosyltransferase family 2 protein [Syntrophales bacterium]|nr:glycosyltransferase family 2 protein [Syntrophales bacterium]
MKTAKSKQQQPDVSVVVVSWNTREILLDCLRSALSTKDRLNMEITVVDNGSVDGSPEAVREYFPGVRIIRNGANLGFSRANNAGIRASTGKYICLVNSDVIFTENCIPLLFDHMEKNPLIGILGPQIIGRDGEVQRSCMGFPTVWNSLCRALALDAIFPNSKLLGGQLLTYWPHDTTREVDVVNGCFWMVRRAALDMVGLLDEKFFIYGEDVDWCRRFRSRNWKVAFYPEAQAVHLGGASSARMPVRFYLEMHRANLQYWKKHHGRRAQNLYRLTLILHDAVRLAAFALLSARDEDRAGSVSMGKVRRSAAGLRMLLSGLDGL